ncbi:NADP-dependent oxidoreductase [Actinomycetospora sp. NBRC 106378]|uniref:MDR family NADP-dependent oxidoreductase n=1 Tax=Actinomycetospora sp. NBRC 106378 TaxID=3032208 RepID=UPI0024A13856|nr:NADP-dependent oxidoreductase [Actinomycetospora sp. NBRC 106378]GLZ51371.1 NADP-dependent oxidoreductase [Actinomycetospora sp. NBRC 106378]
MALPDRTRAIHLVARPDGAVRPDAFRVVDVPVAPPAPGRLLVRVEHLGLAAVLRERMDADADLPFPPLALDEPVNGPVLGTVVLPDAGSVPVGALVAFHGPWAGYAEVDASSVKVLDPALLPSPEYHLATGNGATALHGVRDVAAVGDGDVVVVTGAAGGVGSLAGQIARRLGAARVVGTAGSAEKCRWLVSELGFDVAVDYHDAGFASALRDAAPEGVTAALDLVGGTQLEAAVAASAPHARIAIGGALAAQQAGTPWPRLDTQRVLLHGIRLQGFALAHAPHVLGEWPDLFARWLGEGLVFTHTVVDGGLDAAPQALVDLLAGRYRGHVSVRVN